MHRQQSRLVVAHCTRASTFAAVGARTHTHSTSSSGSDRPRTAHTVDQCQFVSNQHQPTKMAGDDIASHYQVLEELGRGSFGVVYKGIERATGETVAIKHVSRMMRNQPLQFNPLAEPV